MEESKERTVKHVFARVMYVVISLVKDCSCFKCVENWHLAKDCSCYAGCSGCYKCGCCGSYKCG